MFLVYPSEILVKPDVSPRASPRRPQAVHRLIHNNADLWEIVPAGRPTVDEQGAFASGAGQRRRIAKQAVPSPIRRSVISKSPPNHFSSSPGSNPGASLDGPLSLNHGRSERRP